MAAPLVLLVAFKAAATKDRTDNEEVLYYTGVHGPYWRAPLRALLQGPIGDPIGLQPSLCSLLWGPFWIPNWYSLTWAPGSFSQLAIQRGQ